MASGMRLSELLRGLRHGDLSSDPRIYDISSDSRRLGSGGLFVALKGERVDARRLIEQVLADGAAAVLVDGDDQPELTPELAVLPNVVVVQQLRGALSLIAGRLFMHPSHKLRVIGITGTNGKTTIAWSLAQVLTELGTDTAMIGTLGAGRVDTLVETGMTTPDAIELQKQLAQLCQSGVQAVCLEVSSHALELGRVAEIRFDTVVFSNLSQDHLDFHQGMAHYAAAKQRLFEDFDYRLAVINTDDSFGETLAAGLTSDVVTYGVESGRIQARDIMRAPDHLGFTLAVNDRRVAVKTRLIGDFNVYNLLAVCGVAVNQGYTVNEVVRAIEGCRAVPGRMERIDTESNQPVVVVDYAHTPDALDKALGACRGHCAGSLSVVFGCGGDRDRAKRPQMGGIAERGADRVFITDDNPRGEHPAAIVRDIARGMRGEAWILHDRATAIHAALATSGRGDWVLVAGKGHETRQVYADHVVEMDDRTLARNSLRRLAA